MCAVCLHVVYASARSVAHLTRLLLCLSRQVLAVPFFFILNIPPPPEISPLPLPAPLPLSPPRRPPRTSAPHRLRALDGHEEPDRREQHRERPEQRLLRLLPRRQRQRHRLLRRGPGSGVSAQRGLHGGRCAFPLL